MRKIKKFLLAASAVATTAVSALAASVPAFAAEGETGMESAITSGTTTFLGVVSSVLTFILGNPLLILLLVGGTVIPLGISLFKKVKRASK